MTISDNPINENPPQRRRRTRAIYTTNDDATLDWRITQTGMLLVTHRQKESLYPSQSEPKIQEISLPPAEADASAPYCVRSTRKRTNSQTVYLDIPQQGNSFDSTFGM